MKSLRTITFATAALAMGACSEFDPGLSDTATSLTDAEISVLADYAAAFNERYGQPEEGHDWGFTALDPVGGATRAYNNNANQWYQYENGEWKDLSGTLPANYEIPGLPSKVDGKWYVARNSDEGLEIYDSKEDAQNQLRYSGKIVAGDVTDEEIQYVSEWFRTHPNPGRHDIDITECFIMDISHDYDRVSYPNGQAVPLQLDVYRTHNTSDPNNWIGYAKDGGKENIGFNMDYFYLQDQWGEVTHINDFNDGRSNAINGSVPDNSTYFPSRDITYWYSSNGQPIVDAQYHQADQQIMYDDWVLVHLVFDGPRTGNRYDCYYLAFDYRHQKMDSAGKVAYVNPDGYYSNWIVKLAPGDPQWWEDHKNEPADNDDAPDTPVTPGGDDPDTPVTPGGDDPVTPVTPGEEDPGTPVTPGGDDDVTPDDPIVEDPTKARVMCEDLGTTDDFDFNDLVYDVYFTEAEGGGYTAHVTIQAVGGTLPIYIGPYTTECHEILGGQEINENTGLYRPVNVNAGGGIDRAPVSIEFPAATSNPDDIEIRAKKNFADTYDNAQNTILLPASHDNATPQKFAVPVGTKWTVEHQQIELAYPKFKDWVGDSSVKFWNYPAASGLISR